MTDLNKNTELSESTDTAIDYSTCYAPLSHGSLFSGIGGFDLASEWMGWKNEFHCEWNEFGKQVLQYYWPKAKSYDDITKTDFSIWRGKIDILTGGFPCQPYSVAGKRKGTEDDRHLWPEMLRAVREIQPSWIVGENVSGLINWSGGLVFEEVQTDLENEGYEVWANVLPAASVNAPHKRDRVWFVAYSNDNRKSRRTRKNERKSGKEWVQERNEIQQFNESNCVRKFSTAGCSERCNHRGDNRQERQVYNNKNRNAKEDKSERNGRKCRTGEVGQIRNVTDTTSESSGREHEQRPGKRESGRCNCKSDASNTNGTRFQETWTEQQTTRIEQHGELGASFTNTECKRGREVLQNIQPKEPNGNGFNPFNEQTNWEKFPTQAPICDGDDGLSSRLDAITFSKWRTESVKAGGNAIVPQVAFQIFKAINEFCSSGA